MTLFDKLTLERRARLVAEQRLDQRGRELAAARAQIEAMRLELHSLRQRGRTTAAEEAERAAAASDLQSRALAEAESAQRTATMAERRLWDSINTIRDGFAVFNRRHELVIANQAYLGVFAGIPEVQPGIPYRRIAEILAHEERVLLGDLTPEAWVEQMVARWEADRIAPITLAFTRGDTARVHDRRARAGDIVSLVRDITDERRHAAELDDARARAEAASRAKSAFLANMSHEIRTPMNGVVGMAELMCDTPLSEEQRLYAETIRSSGEALLTIINDVLDFSKIEADRMTLHPEPFDLERCIHEVLILLQAGARKRSIDLLLDYDMFLATRFLADPGRMRQVLTNLIGNAVKFTPSGHVLIRVIGMDLAEGRQRLTVSVEDTGIGIAPENIDHIFGEFAQVDEAANRRFEGTGLGLAITRRLVQMMGGQIWVESEPGRGSCFGFALTLPLAEDQTEAPPAPIRLARVLVVDDQLINRTILERQLTALGLAVTLCTSGDEALAVMGGQGAGSGVTVLAAQGDESGDPAPGSTGHGIDLVITDHEMPGFNGLALTRALRAAGHRVPVILLSSAPAVLRDDPAMAEIRAILQKPLLRRDLQRQLQLLSNPGAPVMPSVAGGATPAMPGSGRRMRILTAEDNRTNRLVFAKMTEGLAIELDFAEDGAQAVEGFRRLKPDLIFMDISMPGMDGRAATRAIRQLPGGAQVPIIALTAHAMASDRDEILAAGLDHVLTKPLKKPQLIEMITRYRPEDAAPPAPAMERAG